MTDQCMSIMECATTSNDLTKLFENASPYVKGILTLAETAFEQKPVHAEIPAESCRVVQDNRESRVEFLL